jgi:putative ABC transport system permease protein
MLDTLIRDVRYAARSFARYPGFTATAILTIALGIGATTAIFSIVYGVLIRPLPFPEADRLVMVQPRTSGIDTDAVSPATFLEWESRSRAFEAVAAFTGRPLTLTGNGEPELLAAAAVTIRFFDILQQAAAIGRTFIAAEGTAGGEDVVVISDDFWRRQFQGDAAIVGRRITLDDRPFTVVGVMPAGVVFPEEVLGPRGRFRSIQRVDAWVPLVPSPTERGNAFLRMVARLKPGYTIAQGSADAAAVMRAMAATRPRARNTTATVLPLHEYIVGDNRRELLLLLGAVSLLLVIACANVANLLAARAATRASEVALRSAIGASRGRLIRQFLTESTVLGLIGGVCGIAVAVAALRGLMTVIPSGALPRVGEVAIDIPVLTFTAFLSLATGLIFGLAPVIHLRRSRPETVLHGDTTTHTPRLRLLKVLVVSEVALAIVLLGPATLLVQSFARLTAVNPGFTAENLVTASVTLPPDRYDNVPRMNAVHSAVLQRLTSSGTGNVAAVNWLPFGGNLVMGDVVVEGVPAAGELTVAKIAVSPAYFDVLGVKRARGRVFSEADTDATDPVVVVTERVAGRFWPSQDAIGKRLKLGFGDPLAQQWATVVGVVHDVKQNALSEHDMPAVYMPMSQAPRPFLLSQMTYIVRSSAATPNRERELRAAVRSVDPQLPLSRVATLKELIGTSVSEPRFRSVLLSAFALTALSLVAAGLFGVLMYSVTRRTREIGVRMAVGATPAAVSRLVILEMLMVTVAGMVPGVSGAVAAAGLIRNLLFEIEPTDPTPFAIAGLAVLLVSGAASYVPARRAARIDPAVTLKSA